MATKTDEMLYLIYIEYHRESTGSVFLGQRCGYVGRLMSSRCFDECKLHYRKVSTSDSGPRGAVGARLNVSPLRLMTLHLRLILGADGDGVEGSWPADSSLEPLMACSLRALLPAGEALSPASTFS